MKESKDPMGDRMKMYEGYESDRRLMPLLPVIARLDGIGFHNFTKGMDRPVDDRFRDAMVQTTKHLVEKTGAKLGYTQSDEITLVWYSDTLKSKIFRDGKVLKMATELATEATLEFFLQIQKTMPEYAHRRPRFDARVHNVPTLMEAANNFLWREFDATKNSISMLASCHYSDKQLHGKTGNDRLDLLQAKGVNWNSFPASFKRGVYVQRRQEERSFSRSELAKLPPKHQAHSNPELKVLRSTVEVLDMPIFQKVANRVAVVFEGATPVKIDPTSANFFVDVDTPPEVLEAE